MDSCHALPFSYVMEKQGGETMTKWGKILSVASFTFSLMGVGVFAFGLVHIFSKNQVTPDFVLATMGAGFTVNFGILGLVAIFFNKRVDDLGKRIDQRFDDLGLSPRRRER